MQKKIVKKLLNTEDLPQICMYCGEPAGDREHVYPKVYFGEDTPKVWSCRECNTIAGSKIFDGIEEKQFYINSQLRKKYNKVMSQPDWDEDELKELGYNLRRKVKSMLEKKKWMQKRLDWIAQPNVLIVMQYLKERDTGSVSARTLAEIDTIRPSELSLFVSF